MKQHPLSYRLDAPVTAEGVAERLVPAGTVDPEPQERARLVYFDSFDWRLAERGLCLRTRDGKVAELADASSGAILATADDPLASGFADDIDDCALRAALSPVVEMRRLLPRLRVRLTARPFAVRDSEGKAVLRGRIEHWACRPHKGRAEEQDLRRIVLEPVRGYRGAFRCAAAALEAWRGPPISLGDCLAGSLAAIGTPADPAAGKLRLDLDPTMTAGEAARAIHLVLLDAMVRNQEGAAANIDSEFLHDFRVAVRRTRAALAQVDRDVLPAELVARTKADFRWIGQQTNRMRNLDVYLLDFPGFEAALPDEYRPHLRPFHDHLQREHQGEARRIARLLRGRRYRAIRDSWRTALSDPCRAADGLNGGVPVRELAGHRIWKTYRRLLREGRAIDDASPACALHELRLTAKKLRYLLEFFSDLYPAAWIAPLVKALKALQDVLGRFQDSEIQSAKIVDFAREMVAAGPVPVETQMAMGMVAESILIRGARARRDYHDRFARFARPKLRTVFEELFKPRAPIGRQREAAA